MSIIDFGGGWSRAPVECPECGSEKMVRYAGVLYQCSKCGTRYSVQFDGRYYPNGTPWATTRRER